uniref:Uncharacterized protein n=1 Tax=Trypanosoma vivax (strain Y486) TaxID=1055687 RepID=G0U125_TRYVY|nr:hypothetical protein TVY486_0803880 [Trypanosoma vivax Y486]
MTVCTLPVSASSVAQCYQRLRVSDALCLPPTPSSPLHIALGQRFHLGDLSIMAHGCKTAMYVNASSLVQMLPQCYGWLIGVHSTLSSVASITAGRGKKETNK